MVQPLAICVLSETARAEAEGAGRAALEADLKALVAQVNGVLDKHEQLRGVVLVKDVWAVENGFLTPTLKIKRAVIESNYGKHFEDWLQRCDAVLWHE
jgi:long-subunit acyl-CoA synthetase (AMP-forming)